MSQQLCINVSWAQPLSCQTGKPFRCALLAGEKAHGPLPQVQRIRKKPEVGHLCYLSVVPFPDLFALSGICNNS